VASYSYDGLGRQIEINENNALTVVYYSSSGRSVEEYQSTTLMARDVWSASYVNALVYRQNGSGVRYYPLYDANWNITAWVNSSGAVQERYAYDPYGLVSVLSASWTPLSDSSLKLPYGFQGMRTDWWVNKLDFADDRVYNPWFMAWMQTDPLGLAAGTNDYEMEGDGPTDAVDPSGMAPPVRIVSPTVTNTFQWIQEALLGRKPTPPLLIRPIVEAPGRARSIYEVSREGGEGKAGSTALAGLVIVSDTVGVTNLDEARRGRDIFNNDLTPGERWVRGVVGAGQLATTGKLMYDYPTPGQLRVLNPRVKLNGMKCPTLRVGRTLNGSTEWVVKDAKLAQQELARLQAEYTRATNGLKPQVRPRPPGVTRDAGIDIETGQIFVYDDVPPAFRQGYLAEELHHYFQLEERGLLGPGKTLTPQVEKAIEAEVVGRVKRSGFTPYDPRNYAPYTDLPRPPGVAGN